MAKPTFNFDTWRQRLLEIRDPKTHEEAKEFWALVDQVDGKRINEKQKLEVARTLLQTFTDVPDHGVKESVFRSLETFDPMLYYRVYLEELPRLMHETSQTEWYLLLAAYPKRELTKSEAKTLSQLLKSSSAEARKQFLEIIRQEEFVEDHSWAKTVLKAFEVEVQECPQSSDDTNAKDSSIRLDEIIKTFSKNRLNGEAVPKDIQLLLRHRDELSQKFDLSLHWETGWEPWLDTSYLSEEDKADPDTMANVRAIEDICALIAFVAEGKDGAYIGFWRGPKHRPVTDSPLVSFDNEGQFNLCGGKTLSEALLAHVYNGYDEEAFSEFRDWLHSIGIKVSWKTPDDIAYPEEDSPPDELHNAAYERYLAQGSTLTAAERDKAVLKCPLEDLQRITASSLYTQHKDEWGYLALYIDDVYIWVRPDYTNEHGVKTLITLCMEQDGTYGIQVHYVFPKSFLWFKKQKEPVMEPMYYPVKKGAKWKPWDKKTPDVYRNQFRRYWPKLTQYVEAYEAIPAAAHAQLQKEIAKTITADKIQGYLALPIVQTKYTDYNDPDKNGYWCGDYHFAFKIPDKEFGRIQITRARDDDSLKNFPTVTDGFDTYGYQFDVNYRDNGSASVELRFMPHNGRGSRPLLPFEYNDYKEALTYWKYFEKHIKPMYRARLQKCGDVIEIRYNDDTYLYARSFEKSSLRIGLYDYAGKRLDDISKLRSYPYRLFADVIEEDAFSTGVFSKRGNLPFLENEIQDYPPIYRVQYTIPGDETSPPRYFITHKGLEREGTKKEIKGMQEMSFLDIPDLLNRISHDFKLPVSPAAVQSEATSSSGAPDWESFSNDDAADWLGEFLETPKIGEIRSALSAAADLDSEAYLEVREARIAIAAVEFVAWALGRGPAWWPSPILKELNTPQMKRLSQKLPELKPLAIQAVNRVLEQSELKELWEESSDYGSWEAAVKNLLQRLRL